MLRNSSVSVRVPYPNCDSDTGIHMTWRIGQEVGDHVSPQTEWIIQFAWRLWGIVASLHASYRCAISNVMAGGCLYRPSGTGYMLPSWNPGKLGRSSTNSWSNNWVHWRPVLPACELWLTIGTERFWQISAGTHLSSLGCICCYLLRRRRPGTGDIATPPVRPSVCLSVRLSVTFSFRTVTQKRIAVFSRNFAGTCTKSWGCAV